MERKPKKDRTKSRRKTHRIPQTTPHVNDFNTTGESFNYAPPETVVSSSAEADTTMNEVNISPKITDSKFLAIRSARLRKQKGRDIIIGDGTQNTEPIVRDGHADVETTPVADSEILSDLLAPPAEEHHISVEEIDRREHRDIPVAGGITHNRQQQGSEQSGFAEDEKEDSDRALNSNSVIMASVVDEEQLLRELLSRRIHNAGEEQLLHDLMAWNGVQAGNVVTGAIGVPVEEAHTAQIRDSPEDHQDQQNGRKPRFATTRNMVLAGSIMLSVVIVIAIVVAVMLVSQSKDSKSPLPTLTAKPTIIASVSPSAGSASPSVAVPPTARPSSKPTAAPVSRLEAFRSVLLNQSVSSSQNLDLRGSPQNQALNWLAYNDLFNLNISSSAETIVDRYVLAVIYFADNGYKWNQTSNFLTADSICNWNGLNGTGVFCSPPDILFGSNGQQGPTLTELVLANNGLSGLVPAEVGKLSSLTHLDLSSSRQIQTAHNPAYYIFPALFKTIVGNALYGEIPTELGLLTNLAFLALNYTKINGTIPTELGLLSYLSDLDLERNNIIGTMPTELGRMWRLKSLSLYGNQLTGKLPVELGRLANLSTLWLNGNNLTGTIPNDLSTLSGLIGLDLGGNRLTGTIHTELGQLSSIKILSLSSNRFNGTFPSEFGQLSRLTKLYLDFNDLHGSIPSETGYLSSLALLSLYGNQFAGTIPTELGLLSNSLTSLSLSTNQFSGAIPTELGYLSGLTELGVSSNRLSGTVPTFLAALTNLRYLWLENNSISGNLTLALCNEDIYLHFSADCKSKVECSCCTECY